MRRQTAEAPTVPRAGGHRGIWADAALRLAKNKLAVAGGIILLLLVIAAIFAPFIAPKGYAEGSLEQNYATPGKRYLLGADFMGRDLLSRIIYGTRVSLTVGVVGATLATIIGVIYGSISGFYGGRIDNWMMRFVDLMYGLPTLLLIILIMVYFRSSSLVGVESNPVIKALSVIDDAIGGMFFIFIGIATTSWLTMSRLVRGMILSLKEQQFVEAALVAGASDFRIMSRHLLPNFLGPVIVAETLNIPNYIIIEAFLSFIGLGVNPPMPSWGGMISEGFRGMRSYPHLVLFPAMALSITLLAFNFLGDGLRDALDPRMR
ncbi:MAG: ABC transporter permease [Chloroflexi bacterium]|nr:ABC transporter permease [Chloroflexota bacterium]